MAHTYYANDYNSTPFSSCCGVASQGSNGGPADRCHGCGEAITHHVDSLAVSAARRLRAEGRCGMCGMRIGDPAVAGNCHC